jgi:segregation and condensation protein B
LLEKQLVEIQGKSEGVGKPILYGTTEKFMDYFGINSTDDLPKINEVLMEEMVQATVINNDAAQEDENKEDSEESAELAVTETGEIVEHKQVAEEKSTEEAPATHDSDEAMEDKQVKDEEDHSES